MSTGRSGAVPGRRTAGRPTALPGAQSRLALGDDLGIEPELRRSRWADLDAAAADGLLRLRAADGDTALRTGVHVVAAVEPVDLDDATEHVWIPDDSGPVAYLRVRPAADRSTPDPPTVLVERLCVRADVRQIGLGSALLADVVARHGGTTLLADVPLHATGTFARFGFVTVGVVAGTTPPAGGRARLRRAPDTPWREE